LVAGIIAGTAFQFVEWGYINFQVGVSRYNAIYGSFAALPLFLLFVNISWLITLIGAEIAYANQYVAEIQSEIDGDRLSHSQRHVLAMVILRRIALAFDREEDPLPAKQLSTELELPYGVTARILELLVSAKLLSEVEHGRGDETAYVPLKSFDRLRISDVVRALDVTGYTEIPRLKSSEYDRYFVEYNRMRESAERSNSDSLIKELPLLNHNA